MPTKKRRIEIPRALQAQVLFASDRICCICRVKGKPVQIHHIDDNPANNDFDNLAVLCLDCHNETQIRGGFHRKLDAEQVMLYRDDWLKQVSKTRAIDEGKELNEAKAQNLKKEINAWLLLDKAHETPDNNLLEAESFVTKAALPPDVKQEEHRQLGMRMAKAVILNIARYDDLDGSTKYLGQYNEEDRSQLIRSAGRYLEETVLHVTSPDAEELLYLACVYGYQRRFVEMMRTIDKAINLDGAIREYLREPLTLIALLSACGSNRPKIDRLEKWIGMPPVKKDAFCDFIKTFDLKGFFGYIKWIAVKKPRAAGKRGVFLSMIAPQPNGVVWAFSEMIENRTTEVAPHSIVSTEELYDAVSHSFILICPIKRGYPYL